MSDNNGWAGKPGVPLNPEQDGWHWGERDGGLEPRFWSSGQQSWAGARNSWITPKMLAALFDYAGPCLTPAEVDARVTQARRDALEEAARAMKPMLRSMISRDEAVRIIRALAKGEGDE
jgi:hypothetical protein